MVNGARLLALFAALLSPAARHPTHTSSAELAHTSDSVQVAIRVFADDIAAVGPLPGYLRNHFALVDRSGRPVALEWRGMETAGDVVTVRLGGPLAGGLSGSRVTDLVLTDRYADQVNVVRATSGSRSATLIFTRGDGPKAIP